jgi:transposase
MVPILRVFYILRAGCPWRLLPHDFPPWALRTLVDEANRRLPHPSHFFISATVSAGPSNDGPQFAPAMKQASLFISWDRVLGDAAFDSEENHRHCREDLGVRSTGRPRLGPAQLSPK